MAPSLWSRRPSAIRSPCLRTTAGRQGDRNCPRTLPGSVRAGCATSLADLLHGPAGGCHFHQDLNNESMQVRGAYTVEYREHENFCIRVL